jgi:hypothetical protein
VTNPTDPAASEPEAGAAPAPERVGSTRWRSVVALSIVALVIVALGAGLATVWSRTSDLEDDLAAASRGARDATVAGRRLTARVDDLANAVGDLPDAPASTGGGVNAVKSDIATFKKCVNLYMDTIGAWSSNVESRFDYTFC